MEVDAIRAGFGGAGCSGFRHVAKNIFRLPSLSIRNRRALNFSITKKNFSGAAPPIRPQPPRENSYMPDARVPKPIVLFANYSAIPEGSTHCFDLIRKSRATPPK